MPQRCYVIAATLAGVCLVGAVAAGQQNRGNRLEGVELTTIHVAGNVYMLQRPGGGGNVGVFVGSEGVLLVDSLFAPLADRLVAAVREISDGEIRFLINTHVHPDHIGGNENLAAAGVLVLAHDNVRVRALERLRYPRGGGRFAPQPPAAGRPFLTYNDSVSFHFNDEEVRAFLAPAAHTDGDTFVYFPESDVLHLGDVFRTTSYPIIDAFNGGTLAGTIAALELAIDMAGPQTKVIPGHGLYVVDRSAMVEFLDMIVDVRDRVRTLISQGSTLDEVMAARPTAAYDAQWGQEASWTANDFVPIVFHELGGGSLYVPPRGKEMREAGGISLRLSEPRIKPLEESEWTEVERALLAPIKEERGSVPNIYRTFARHPEIFTPRLRFGRHLQRGSTLPARDREVLINRIAWLSNAEYEWSAHTRLGSEAGLSDEDIVRIANGPEARGGREFDRTLLLATDELFMETMISDSTWQALSQSYDTHQMMDVVMTVGGYHMLAMALNSFGVQLPDGAAGFPPPGARQAALPTGRAGTPTRLGEPRIAPISPDSWSEEERELLEPLVESRGYLPNVYGTLANHPTMYGLWIDFAGQILRRSSLPAREREMLIKRIAWLASGEYEWAAHNPIGRREGLTEEEITALAAGPEDEVWSGDDRALLRAVDELHRSCFIENETWEMLSGRFDDHQMIDLVLTVGAYKMLAMALNSFGAQLQDGMVGFSLP